MKLITTLSLSLFLFFQFSDIKAQASYSQKDVDAYDAYMEWIEPHKNEATNHLLVRTAKYFLWTPYEAETLEKEGEEKLVVNLRSFDCATYVETTIALVKTIKSGNIRFDNFCKILQAMRYRGGVIDGYSSRLHYMSDWIYDNKKMGLANDISLKLGGEVEHKVFNFMSMNASKYPKLKGDSEEISKIRDIEKTITDRNTYCVLSPADMKYNIKLIRDGDIVFFATKKGGLDYSHMGIAYWTLDGLCFIHASSKDKEVTQNKQTLYTYIYKTPGISIVRLADSTK